MATAKMETAAERYRRIKNERLKLEKLYDFESPSGMLWKLRRPNIAQFVMSGVMPMTLAGKLATASEKGGDPAQAFDALDWKDKARTIEFSSAVVRFCAVEPKIVQTPTQPDEIGYDEVEMDDFNAIFAWAMPGGDGADTLSTFRAE